jgi:hypothetical protein
MSASTYDSVTRKTGKKRGEKDSEVNKTKN